MPFRRMLFLFVLFAACLAPLSAQLSGSPVAITLERTACFGSCPIYTVSIFEDGTVLYTGERHVDVTGQQTGRIDPEQVAAIVESFADAGYFEWDEEFDPCATDNPTIITSVTRDGETHRIARSAAACSAPIALPYLEAWIDYVARTAQWTGQRTDFAAIGQYQSAVIMMERGPCLGACPIDTVTLFEDGTAIYVGMQFTDTSGVRVYQVDAEAVRSIAEFAETIGFFDWEDSYHDIAFTDAPSVTLMIQAADQYKRITRNTADFSAPIGLGELEARIHALLEQAVQVAGSDE